MSPLSMTAFLLMATTIVFRGVTVIDGTGAQPKTNMLVVVSDDRIREISPVNRESLARLPAGAEVLPAEGKWLLPGLIDAHVHAGSQEDLKAMLRWGITSVRLMAEDVAAARRMAEASRRRDDIPEVFAAAPIFTARGGWWDQGQPADRNVNRFPATAEEAREAVRKAKKLGSGEIKLMLDDMTWCRAPKPPLPRMKPDVARALIGEARAEGLRAIVHAPNLADAVEAIAGGATALAHGVLDVFDAKTIAVIQSRPVFYIPTMDIFEFLADTRSFVDSVLSDPRAAGGLPPAIVDRYRSSGYSDGYRARYPNFANVKRHLPALRENLRRLHAAGVPVALGTDMWAFPGLGVSIEMDLYVRSGISAPDAIRAATQTAARCVGLEKDRGTIEPGKRADLLLLDADPLADMKNVRSIAAIYKAGRRVGPIHPITRSPDHPIPQ